MADTTPPKKKLPFKQRKKPSAPTPISRDNAARNEDELDLFSRRKEMQPILEADRKRRLEKERRKAKALAKAKGQDGVKKEQGAVQHNTSGKRPLEDEDEEYFDAQERQSFGDDADPEVVPTDESMTVKGDSFDTPATPPASKRTRTEFGSTSSRNKAATPRSAQRDDASPALRRGLRSHSAMSTPNKTSKFDPLGPSAGRAVISLDSDDDDDEVDLKPPVKPPARTDSIEILDETLSQEDIDEDDEFADAIRKAEEEKKRLAAEVDGAAAHVLVTSEIEGTAPLNMKLKLDQPLIKLRGAWVQTQLHKNHVQLPCPAADLVLSWQRAKVYNYSTLYSLGVRVQGDSLSTGSGINWKGLTSRGRQVHLEISTQEIFKKWEEERERQRRKDEAQHLSDDEVEPVVEEEVKLRVVLKARDLEDLKLTVRPNTTTETLTAAYKRSRKLDDGKDITLWFDGDQMQKQSTLEDMYIDDLDTIEVHIN